GARDRELVVFRKFIHAENGDDVLQRFIGLQRFLNRGGDVVVFFADDARVKNTRGRVERVNRRVNPLLCDLTGKNGRRVKVREGRCRRGVGQVVRGNVNGLNGSNRAFV